MFMILLKNSTFFLSFLPLFPLPSPPFIHPFIPLAFLSSFLFFFLSFLFPSLPLSFSSPSLPPSLSFFLLPFYLNMRHINDSTIPIRTRKYS
jgi:hypothetical protein